MGPPSPAPVDDQALSELRDRYEIALDARMSASVECREASHALLEAVTRAGMAVEHADKFAGISDDVSNAAGDLVGEVHRRYERAAQTLRAAESRLHDSQKRFERAQALYDAQRADEMLRIELLYLNDDTAGR
jgi:hypothetical protein